MITCYVDGEISSETTWNLNDFYIELIKEGKEETLK
jgi:hypothetical protein